MIWLGMFTIAALAFGYLKVRRTRKDAAVAPTLGINL